MLVTSPFALNLIIMFVSFFGVVIVAAIAGQATYQDLDSNSTAFFYTAPITKFDYLAGRYLGALATQIVIFTSVGFGAFVGTRMPWLDPARVGPQSAFSYLQPYCTMVIPNLIFVSAIFFCLAALGKKMLPVYAGSVILLIAYFVADQLSSNLTLTTLAAMVDPFGGNAVARLTQYWTPFQRNTQIIPLAGVLLLNRILWLSIGAVILGVHLRPLLLHATPPSRKTRATARTRAEHLVVTAQALPTVHPTFSRADSFRELILSHSPAILRNGEERLLRGAGAGGRADVHLLCLRPQLAVLHSGVSRHLADARTGRRRLHSLHSRDHHVLFRRTGLARARRAAQPDHGRAAGAAVGACSAASSFALMLVQVLLVLMVMACGIFVQVLHGYHHFEFGLYLTDLFGHRLIAFWILCAIAMLVHTIVNHKYLGHFVMVLYFVASIALPQMNLQDYLYRLGRSPHGNFLRHERLWPVRCAAGLVSPVLGNRRGAAGHRDQFVVGARHGNWLARPLQARRERGFRSLRSGAGYDRLIALRCRRRIHLLQHARPQPLPDNFKNPGRSRSVRDQVQAIQNRCRSPD